MFVLFLNAGCARQKSFMMLEDDVLDQDRDSNPSRSGVYG